VREPALWIITVARKTLQFNQEIVPETETAIIRPDVDKAMRFDSRSNTRHLRKVDGIGDQKMADITPLVTVM
jgi:hypothetical protein